MPIDPRGLLDLVKDKAAIAKVEIVPQPPAARHPEAIEDLELVHASGRHPRLTVWEDRVLLVPTYCLDDDVVFDLGLLGESSTEALAALIIGYVTM